MSHNNILKRSTDFCLSQNLLSTKAIKNFNFSSAFLV